MKKYVFYMILTIFCLPVQRQRMDLFILTSDMAALLLMVKASTPELISV